MIDIQVDNNIVLQEKFILLSLRMRISGENCTEKNSITSMKNSQNVDTYAVKDHCA